MNKHQLIWKAASLTLVGASLLAGGSSAQAKFDKKAFLKKYVDAANKIPEKHKKLLSSGYQNFLQFAQQVNEKRIKAGIGDDGGLINTTGQAQAKAQVSLNEEAKGEQVIGPGGTTVVSSPSLDFQTSQVAGFTQSETSMAWCGRSVVVGFNDSGALLRTAGVNPSSGASFNSAAISANGGRTFIDNGFLNPGSDPANFLQGDPVVICTSPSQFYYSSIFATATAPDSTGTRSPLSAVAVNASFNGGLVWQPPVAAVVKDGNSHGLDKPWLSADPTNPQRLYVTYTDFDFTFPFTGTCANDFRIAIELVTSNDGGSTWSVPVVIDEQCGASFNGVQGSSVVVSPGGKVYVVWEFIPGRTPNNEIHFRSSLDHGQSFSSTAVINPDVVPNGADGRLMGGFRNNEFPQIAVDRSDKPSRGTIYVVWSDGRNNVVPDLGSITTGAYAYPDILISKSKDFGKTWSAPVTVSPQRSSFIGLGRDQFFPGVAVDKEGHVAVAYYDRRGDPENTVIDRYASVSRDHGSSWSEQQLSFSSWLPVHFSDHFIDSAYIGDYDALASDFTLKFAGFNGAFEIQSNGNPDVYCKKF